MCGIAGYIGKGNRDELSRMATCLVHRGPDDHGVWETEGAGLAHTRLAILDLSPAGHQPMLNPTGDIVISFNGEIYNYKKLRAELEQKGVRFIGHSDTEVILSLYAREGANCFAKLEGMFAIAIYDKKNGLLVLARDRAGEKPLYYGSFNGTFLFASEPKAIFAHSGALKRLDTLSVFEYLAFDSIPVPRSIYHGVHKLEPATYLSYTKGVITQKQYWTPPSVVVSQTFTAAEQCLDAELSRSVASQLVASDVPVGVFLSGGLDSSAIAYYAQKASASPIHTFSIGFREPSYDESGYARLVAETLKTDHHERILSPEDVRAALPEIFAKLDEPIADATVIPNYLLSQFAREHVTVALGGEGSDELFAGYQTFAAEHYADWYARVPAVFRKGVIEPIVRNLPVSHKYFSFDFKAKQFIRGAASSKNYRHQKWLESFDEDERMQVLAKGLQEEIRAANPYRRIDELLQEYPSTNSYLATQYLYLRTYLLDVILAKVDRSSMMHALEIRAPFLDSRVMEVAFGLPWKYKYHQGKGKYILKKLMEGRLPPQIIERKKHGFALPVGEWMRGPWKELLLVELSEESMRSAGICDSLYVTRLVTEHISGAKNHRKKLWSLLALHLWHKNWMGRA